MHVSLSGNDYVALFEWRRQWRYIDTKIDNYVIIASLKSEPIGKLINIEYQRWVQQCECSPSARWLVPIFIHNV